MNEDEIVEALEWALSSTKPTGITGWAEYWVDRALLDAVRLIREHELMGECNPNSDETYNTHGPECSVGMWVRAAARAGL